MTLNFKLSISTWGITLELYLQKIWLLDVWFVVIFVSGAENNLKCIDLMDYYQVLKVVWCDDWGMIKKRYKMMIIKYLEVLIIKSFIIKACGILIVEVQLVMNCVEIGTSGFIVTVD